MIPIFSPQPQYAILKDSIDQALTQVAASGQYILGPQVTDFETAFARETATAYAAGVANGSDALYLALRALNIGPGDEVITTPFSYIATSESIVRTGAKAVFVDIEADSFNIDPALIAQAITPATKALLPVHLFGRAANMDAILDLAQAHNLTVVEDCAQAVGATWQGKPVGSMGQIGCFSFFPTKNLGAMGDAGAVTTQDAALNASLRSLRVHGATPENRYDHQAAGINSRLDSLQAVVLSLKLPHLAEWNAERLRLAHRYTAKIQSGPLADHLLPPGEPVVANSVHVFHQYTVRIQGRDAAFREQLQADLLSRGVMAMIYYPIPLHLQQSHHALGYKPGDMPVAEAAAREVLSLPMYPGLTDADQDTVLAALESILLGQPVGASA